MIKESLEEWSLCGAVHGAENYSALTSLNSSPHQCLFLFYLFLQFWGCVDLSKNLIPPWALTPLTSHNKFSNLHGYTTPGQCCQQILPNTCTHHGATSPVRAEAPLSLSVSLSVSLSHPRSLQLIEWEKLSSSFAAVICHRSVCKQDTVATDPERTCLQAKGRQMDSSYLPESSIHSDQFSCLCLEPWETGAGFRVAQVMCDDGAELSGPDSHQIRPDYARLHNEYFTKINHGWAEAPFCWFHWEGRETGKPGEVLTGCLQPQGKWRQ